MATESPGGFPRQLADGSGSVKSMQAAKGSALGRVPAERAEDEEAGADPRAEEQSVLLRIEFIDRREGNQLQWAVGLLTLVLTGVTLMVFIRKLSAGDNDRSLFSSDVWYIAHLVTGAVALAVLLVIALVFAQRTLLMVRQHKHWCRRRYVLARVSAVLLALQVVNVVFWVAPYSYILAHHCSWFDRPIRWFAITRWTLYNAEWAWGMVYMMHGCCRYRGRYRPAAPAGGCGAEEQLLVMDVPLRHSWPLHLPMLLAWAVFQCMLIGEVTVKEMETRVPLPPGVDCTTYNYVCNPPAAAAVFMYIRAGMTFLYCFAYCYYVRRAAADHRLLPYAHFRLTYMSIRVQARHGLTAMFVVVISVIFLQLVNMGSCWSYVDVQLGIVPVQLAMSAYIAVVAFLMMPKGSYASTVTRNWLREFSWTEADLPMAVARRDAELHAALPQLDALSSGLNQAWRALSFAHQRLSQARRYVTGEGATPKKGAVEVMHEAPIFCLELAVKLQHWSRLAYLYKARKILGPISEDTGLALFGLRHFAEEYCPETDTRAVLGWANGLLVLSFRGTASKKNVITDIKAWNAVHLPKRYRGSTLVKVHAGFYEAWTGGGYSARIMARVQEVVDGFSPTSGLRFLVTGHSLGGALAALAAHAIARHYPGCKVTAYTYGAPRLGNMAWRAEYQETVPDTWEVLHDQDPIPRLPAHGKRSGQRVILNTRGDIIIRPSFFELSIMSRSGGVMAHHRCRAYAVALACVMKAQFDPFRSLPGGAAAVEDIAGRMDMDATLLLVNSSLDALKHSAAKPLTRELAAEREEKISRRAEAKAQPGCLAAIIGRSPTNMQDMDAQDGAMEEGDAGPADEQDALAQQQQGEAGFSDALRGTLRRAGSTVVEAAEAVELQLHRPP